ncbi:MAG TPA: winged helix-turn-helix domain-containing protein, partial [Candidatus Avibacteroides excrementipullorum]|nr:winged helix-turn-helix domain-containing protein [Candidatus Avibacteroides excrementipullorum]
LKDKELFLSLGWLLKEDKVEISGDETDPNIRLR